MSASTKSLEDLRAFVEVFADALAAHQEEINALNVYPVPDGDTGTNMRLTLEAVRTEIAHADDVPTAIVRGSLMGARGNSGVILSQILRGLIESIAEAGQISAASVTTGMRRASDLAYAAVLKPQEGTILTVVRSAADGAEQCTSPSDIVAVTNSALSAARKALQETPEQLPVLKQAGVVDAGGRGLVLLIECLLHLLDGTAIPEATVAARSATEAAGSGGHSEHEGSLEFKFEVQMLLDAPDEDAAQYRLLLDNYGDCVLVVGTGGTHNVHVHTNEVGAVIEHAIDIGRPRNIEVTYMEGQVADLHEAAVLARMNGEPEPQETGPLDPVGIVAIAAGEGILSIFRSLGVKGLVAGGQTFNPSAEEVLEGIRKAHGEEVIILPNNKNVIASARTAAKVAVEEGLAKRVEVIPTESPLQAFAALLAYSPDADLDETLTAMAEDAERTRHGEVAYAVRDAETPAGTVQRGQVLGMCNGDVVAVGHDPADAVMQVLDAMKTGEASLVTLVYGAEIDEWSAHELGKRVSSTYGVEVEVHRGGQPHYPYLIGVE